MQGRREALEMKGVTLKAGRAQMGNIMHGRNESELHSLRKMNLKIFPGI